MTPRLVFFDVDGTLIPGHTWDGILEYPGISRRKVIWLRLSTLPIRVLRRLYLLGQARFYQIFMQRLAGLMKKWTQGELDEMFGWLAGTYLQESYRPDVVKILNEYKAQGSQIVLVSVLFEEGIRKICEHLNADGAIGTRLEIVNGKVTGKILGDACIGPRKLNFLRQYLAAQGISLQDCAAYADSYYDDAPMLAIVGMPVAVYPDENLHLTAIEQQWAIYPEPWETRGTKKQGAEAP